MAGSTAGIRATMRPPSIPPHDPVHGPEAQPLAVLETAAEERFERCTRLARRLLDVPIAMVTLADGAQPWLPGSRPLEEPPREPQPSLCHRAMDCDDVFVVPDARADARFADHALVLGAPYVRFYAGVPLRGPGGLRLGALCVLDRRPRALVDGDVQALRDLGAIVADELAALRLATVDPLTGLANRRGFFALARTALALCSRSRQQAVVAMIDLDRFKAINDGFGHHEGDCALAEFGQILIATFRESDIVARLGGDEFGVLLTNTNLLDAPRALSRLEQTVAKRNATTTRPYALSFSCGIAACRGDAPSFVADMQAADAHMFALKRARARVG